MKLFLVLAAIVVVVTVGGIAALVYPYWRAMRGGWGH